MWFLRLFIRFIFTVFIRVKVYDREKLPKEGAVILASNHETMLDMFMIGYKIPRLVHWMAKSELFKNKLMAKFITWLGAYPVKRGVRDQSSVRTTNVLLEKGEVVGIFPQGTRSKGKNRILKVKSGVAHFAVSSGAVIQPVAIWGKFRLFGKVHVKFGDPYKIEKTQDNYSKEDYEAITNELMDNIYNLMTIPSKEKE